MSIYTGYRFPYLLPNVLFCVPGSHPGLLLHLLVKFPPVPLGSHSVSDLDCLWWPGSLCRVFCQVFCRVSFSWDLCDIFLRWDWGDRFLGARPQRHAAIFLTLCPGHLLIWLIIPLNTTQVVLVSFLPCNLPFPSCLYCILYDSHYAQPTRKEGGSALPTSLEAEPLSQLLEICLFSCIYLSVHYLFITNGLVIFFFCIFGYNLIPFYGFCCSNHSDLGHRKLFHLAFVSLTYSHCSFILEFVCF